MNKNLAVTGVIAVALVGGFTALFLVLSFLGVDLYRLQIAPPRTITVIGTATDDNLNQVARFGANVSEIGDSKEAVNQLMQEKIQALIQSAKDFGLAEKDIQTQFFNVYQEEITNFEAPTPEVKRGPWRGNTNVSFSNVPSDQAQAFADILVQSGATSIDGPSFGLEDTTASQDKLASLALENAKTKAAEIANSQGLSLGKVLAIDETGSGGGLTPFYAMREMSGGGGGGFAPGGTEVMKTIIVTYELR
jgi:uncharacterized protein YggE